MSYLKLPTGVQDYAVGLQSLNQANDNAEAQYFLWREKHGVGNDGFSTSTYVNPFDAVGRHHDILIARTVAHCYVDSTGVTPLLLAYFSGPALGSLTYQRLAAGQWRIFIAAPYLFMGVAQMPASATVDYQARTYRTHDPAFGPSLIVSTWAVSGGAWALADLPFDLAIWMQR